MMCMKRLYLMLLGLAACMVAGAQEYMRINNQYYIPLNKVKSIQTFVREHEGSLSKLLEKNEDISIYTEALKATGIMDSLKCYKDETYGWKSEQDRIDSCTWSNDRLCIHTAVEYDNVAYPELRKFEHTVFVCPDKVLAAKYGIKSLDDLRKKAKGIYDALYPEDAMVSDERDARNSLNRFVAYHVLNFYGGYYSLTAMDGPNGKLQYNFNRRKYDICDWYETMMPHSIMKFSYPSGAETGLYINRRGVQSRADERGVFVNGTKVVYPDEYDYDNNGVNGIYHYVDDILAYDKNVQKVVCDDVIRMDCSTLSPDFMTRGADGEMARGHSTLASHDGGMYGDGGQGLSASVNKNTCVGFKPGYVRNFKFGNNTHIHVRNRVLDFWSYEADEVTIKGGRFDVSVKLPPVPAGTYEVRMFFCSGFASRGITAFYLDGVPQGMPVDMRPGGRTLFNNKSDSDLGNDPESMAAFDQIIHNKGWMKGPKCYEPGSRSSYVSGSPMRDLPNTVRKVIGKFTTDGKSDHWLRIEQLFESTECELNFDFIELVPASVYDNEEYLESIY